MSQGLPEICALSSHLARAFKHVFFRCWLHSAKLSSYHDAAGFEITCWRMRLLLTAIHFIIGHSSYAAAWGLVFAPLAAG